MRWSSLCESDHFHLIFGSGKQRILFHSSQKAHANSHCTTTVISKRAKRKFRRNNFYVLIHFGAQEYFRLAVNFRSGIRSVREHSF